MKNLLELREVEKVIESVASRFTIPGSDFEDLVQLGRIAVWKMFENHPEITHITVKDHLGLTHTTVHRTLQNEMKAAKRKKRSILNQARSLDAPVRSDSDTTLAELIKDPSTLGETSKSESMTLLKKLELKAYKDRSRENVSAVIWLLVHVLDMSREEIPRKLNHSVFVQNGLLKFLWTFFNSSPSRAINYAYPNEFERHHLRSPLGYWDGLRGKARAIKTLRETLNRSGYQPEQYPKLMTERFLEEFRLITPLTKIYGRDRFAYLNDAFPKKYYPWEFQFSPYFFFDDIENVKKAVRWLVEKKLGYRMEELDVHEVWKLKIAIKITKDTFTECGLTEIIHNYHSPEQPLRMTYPDKFLDWSFQSKTKWKGEEGKKLAGRATRWVIEDYCKLKPDSCNLGWKFFIENGLHGMITSRILGFNSSPQAALKNAYPNLY